MQGNPLLSQEGLDHAEPKSYQRQSTTQAISVRSQIRSAAPRASTINKMDTLASGTRSPVAMERYDPAVGAHSLMPSHKMREHLLQSQRSNTADGSSSAANMHTYATAWQRKKPPGHKYLPFPEDSGRSSSERDSSEQPALLKNEWRRDGLKNKSILR